MKIVIQVFIPSDSREQCVDVSWQSEKLNAFVNLVKDEMMILPPTMQN